MSERYRLASEESEVEDTHYPVPNGPTGHEGGYRPLLLSSIFKGDAISGSLNAILEAIQDHCSKHLIPAIIALYRFASGLGEALDSS